MPERWCNTGIEHLERRTSDWCQWVDWRGKRQTGKADCSLHVHNRSACFTNIRLIYVAFNTNKRQNACTDTSTVTPVCAFLKCVKFKSSLRRKSVRPAVNFDRRPPLLFYMTRWPTMSQVMYLVSHQSGGSFPRRRHGNFLRQPFCFIVRGKPKWTRNYRYFYAHYSVAYANLRPPCRRLPFLF